MFGKNKRQSCFLDFPPFLTLIVSEIDYFEAISSAALQVSGESRPLAALRSGWSIVYLIIYGSPNRVSSLPRFHLQKSFSNKQLQSERHAHAVSESFSRELWSWKGLQRSSRSAESSFDFFFLFFERKKGAKCVFCGGKKNTPAIAAQK